MRSNLESALDALVSAGWANSSDGDVEAPTGHFAIIDATTERATMGDVLEDTGLTIYDVPVAWFVVVTDSLGFIHPIECASEAEAWSLYREREREYVAWSDDTDD